MKIVKYSEFLLNETKKSAGASLELMKMFDDKPSVKIGNDKWPDEKGIYSQSGMIKNFKDKYSTDDILGALHILRNDKKIKLDMILVKNFVYDEKLPYYYTGLTKEEATKIKDSYEKENEEFAKPQLKKKADLNKKAAAEKASKSTRKPRVKKETTTPTRKGATRKPKV